MPNGDFLQNYSTIADKSCAVNSKKWTHYSRMCMWPTWNEKLLVGVADSAVAAGDIGLIRDK